MEERLNLETQLGKGGSERKLRREKHGSADDGVAGGGGGEIVRGWIVLAFSGFGV